MKNYQSINERIKQKSTSFAYIIMGCGLAFLPNLLVCPHTPGAEYMHCWYTAKIMIIAGALIACAGLLLTMSEKMGWKLGVHSFSAVSAYAATLIPAKIVGGCAMETMPCHAVAFPVIYGFAGIVILTAIISMAKELATVCLDTGTVKDKRKITS